MKALLFGASRVFGESAEGYRWAQDQIARLMLGRYELLLTSATPGPEVWAEATALRWGLPVIVFHADGRRTDSRGKGPARWAPENIKASSRQRDEAIAQATAKACETKEQTRLVDCYWHYRPGDGLLVLVHEESGKEIESHLASPEEREFWAQGGLFSDDEVH